MPEYDKNNRGVLFKNDRKESENQPDYKGSSEVNGVEYWVSAWIKTSKQGMEFYSLAFTPKNERREYGDPPQGKQQNNTQDTPPDTGKFNDDIPF